ncbi:hypothetical protein KFK09_019546 [Dendrobium nobile]|uniref:Reverse transcriptase zinc-binding domain-containing protein n=1 Tax=Dendrobium nobile TaxID=94219 RepID=A0A8T3APS6_DENNO|nr:hypothetical protein KFK09_019546 [Dendrobium nobile]
MNFFDQFEKISGLSFSKNKSCFIASKRITNDRILAIKNVTGFTHSTLPLKYLGVPLFKGRKISFLFNDLIASVQNKLQSWDSNFLSFGGRLTLIKSVLCALPVYCFQTIAPTKTVCSKIHKLINNFFWRGTSSTSKINWAKWENCCGVKEEGGLGCKNLLDLANAFSFKLWFNLRSKDNLWAQFMTAKYCVGKHPSNIFSKHGISRVWRRMCKVKWEVEPFIFWGLGVGDIFFWQDKWLGNDSIDSILNTSSNSSLKVNYFFNNNCWDIDKLFNVVPDCILQRILKMPININSKDIIMYNLSKDGYFYLKNAWNAFRSKGNCDNTFTQIWHKNIPSTISVFVWRALHRYLPTEDNLINKGFILASKCQCCFHNENMHHVLISGLVAVRTWVHFDDLFKLNCFNSHISLISFLKCWLVNFKGHIRNIIPCLIMWFLWLERNNSLFNGVRMCHLNVIQKVKDKMVALMAVNLISIKHFKNYFFVFEALRCNLDFSIPVVRTFQWIKPPRNFYKLNIDVSISGIFGGVTRDSNGLLVAGFAGPLNICDYNTAMNKAILSGCQVCTTLNVFNLIIEVNSAFNFNPLVAEVDSCCNANSFYLIREIKQQLLGLNYSFHHIMNGGNVCASWLARWGCDLIGIIDFFRINCPV